MKIEPQPAFDVVRLGEPFRDMSVAGVTESAASDTANGQAEHEVPSDLSSAPSASATAHR